MNEITYVNYRKLKAKINSLCFYICRIFPIDKKLVSVCTFEGKGGFGCNPKYIVEKLHELDPSIKFVWFVNEDAWYKEFPEYVKKVTNSTWSRAYWLTKSKVWIDNYRKPYGTIKRKNQIYYNTWHGMIGFKCVGLWRGTGFSKIAYLVSKNDSDMIDYLISDSEWGDEVLPKGLLYNKKILRLGGARQDGLLSDQEIKRRKFREKYGLNYDSKCVLFAPTFRESSHNGKRQVFAENWSIDFKQLSNALSTKFGGKWIICMRVHPQIAAESEEYCSINEKSIDVSGIDDLHEILPAMDAVVSDLSSVSFDACFARVPSFVYVDDLKDYEEKRGALFWEFKEIDGKIVAHNNKMMTPKIDTYAPFYIATNNEELEDIINRFNEESYINKINNFENEIQLLIDGKSSERIAKHIMSSLEA